MKRKGNRNRRASARRMAGVLLGLAAVLCCLAALRDSPRGTREGYAARGRSIAAIRPGKPGGTVSINEAGAEELTGLPGIGETLAQAIIDEREKNGPFRYPEDLMAARGIGRAKYEQIRPYLDFDEEEE